MAYNQPQHAEPRATVNLDDLTEDQQAGRAWVWLDTVHVEDDGIKAQAGKDGAWIRIHRLPLMPLATIEAKGTDGKRRVFVEVRYKTVDGETREAVVDMADLSQFNRRDHPLVRDGWAAPAPRRAADVSDAILAMLQGLDVPRRTGYEQAGWHNDHALHIRPGHPDYVGAMIGSTVMEGQEHAWRKVQSELIEDSPGLALATAFMVSSLLRGVVPLPHSTSHILHFYGAPSRGKSTILRVLGSWAGVPDKPSYVDGQSSARGLEHRMAASNHGWLLVDEMDELLAHRPDTGAGTVMFICNGGGREKSSRGGELVTGATWSSHVITSGNADLLELTAGAMKGDALTTRIFSVDILDADLGTFRTVSALDRRLAVLGSNHGWGYPAAIEFIQENRAELIETFGAYMSELRENPRLARLFEDQARLLVFFALSMLGADLVGEIVSPAAGRACHEAVGVALRRYEQDPDEATTQTNVRAFQLLEAVREFVKYNAARFLWKGYAWAGVVPDRSREGSQTTAANDLSHYARTSASGAIGQMEQTRPMLADDDLEGVLTLSPRAIADLEKHASVSRQELVAAAKAFGVLLTQAGREDVKLSASLQKSLGGASRGLRLALRPLTLADGVPAGTARRGSVHHFALTDETGAYIVETWDTETMGPLPEHLEGQQLELLPDDERQEILDQALHVGPVVNPLIYTDEGAPLLDPSPQPGASLAEQLAKREAVRLGRAGEAYDWSDLLARFEQSTQQKR